MGKILSDLYYPDSLHYFCDAQFHWMNFMIGRVRLRMRLQ